jgi:hypothetical protein
MEARGSPPGFFFGRDMEKEAAIAASCPVEEREPRRDVAVWGSYMEGMRGMRCMRSKEDGNKQTLLFHLSIRDYERGGFFIDLTDGRSI